MSALPAPTDHRPWPVPDRAWIMRQTWSQLLFAHWPVPAEELRPLIPPGLEIDTFDGHAWVGVVPFMMSGVALRGLPPVPGTSRFPELNVRTYVRHGERPGVWFFSLDAASRLAVRAARMWFRLPYFDADMRCERVGAATEYASVRTHRGAPPAEFRARYEPAGPVCHAESGSLEHWLTERYCLYAQKGDALLRGEIHHGPWPLRPASGELDTNSMASAAEIELPNTTPLLHYAESIDVVCWSPRRVG